MTLIGHMTMAAGACALLAWSAVARAQDAPGQTRFESAQAAFRALVAAARKGDRAQLLAILGPDGDAVVSSGDEVEDATARRRFATAATERTTFETLDDGAVIAHIGRQGTPFAIPMVQDAGRWRFDTAAGRDELLNRRIGRNEIMTISVLRAYVAAQDEYARTDPTGSGGPAYAQKLRSTAGQRDGLYWDDPDGRDPSPLGPLLADASAEGYDLTDPTAGPQAFHGYYFRILTGQGPDAPGGAKSYLADGRMTGGHALVAWPAEYGASGIMTFLVNQKSIVFQKDLGPGTPQAVKAMTAYAPDATWMPTR
jgi:hypothetical protein